MKSVSNKKVQIFDGAMGTSLQNRNLALSGLPSYLNIENPSVIYDIHLSYLNSGAEYITTNTFSINRLKLKDSIYSCSDLIRSGVKIALKAIKDSKKEAKVALDIGPIGQLLKPAGNIDFEDAVELFKEQIIAGVDAGCDVILIETMSDLYEAKAAIIAAKESCNLPIYCTMTFADTRTFSGTDIQTMVTVLESLGVSALGLNCSTGPKDMIGLVKEASKYCSVPILVQPNAGLPYSKDDKTYYDLSAKEFTKYVKVLVESGASIVGGCCGTTPDYIKECSKELKKISVLKSESKKITSISSYSKTLILEDGPLVVGERINPTGKKHLKAALRSNNISYIVKEAINQQQEGADILDINIGLPEINQVEIMKKAITDIQSVLTIPLQIDSTSVNVIEQAARIYNGKPIINSVNGKESSLKKILPIVKKYGTCVIGLTLDDNGIPQSAEDRFKIAEKIVNRAKSYGINKKDIIIDCLTLTASAQQEDVFETLKAIEMVKEKLNVKTALGVSNISFGLPNRELINKSFFAMALYAGLDLAIINSGNQEMMNTLSSFKVLANIDIKAKTYIEKFSGQDKPLKIKRSEYSLKEHILKGIKGDIKKVTELELDNKEASVIINEVMIPSLNEIGEKFEKGIIFLPQLIQSAEVAKECFDILKQKSPAENKIQKSKILLATVEGDIHDIGKNIVKVILENYGYQVIDLGKDVSPKQILKKVQEENIKLVGLSALMTTTVKNMQKTIDLIRTHTEDCKVMVGGAVLNPKYAEMINADYYAKDAHEGVLIAEKHFNNQ